MLESNPVFSIIIPCYNQAHFLSDAVCSVLDQDFKRWEVIIVNDGSTDNTIEVASKFIRADNRIQLVNKSNGGLSSARNAGLQMANGRILQFLDADDLLLSNCLKVVYNCFEEQPDLTILRVGYQYLSEDKAYILHRVQPSDWGDYIPKIFTNNLGPCHSIFIKRELTKDIGDFDESLKSAEDWDLWIRAAKAGAKLNSAPDVLVSYRYVSTSMSRNSFIMYDAQKNVILRGPIMDHRIKIRSKYNIERNVDVTAGIKKQMLMCLGVAVMQGKIAEAARLFNTEQAKFNWIVSSSDFKHMYSYLSFRYWSKREDINIIFREYYPLYDQFFSSIDLSKEEHSEAMRAIFISPLKIRNRNKFGSVLGKLINYLTN